MWKTEQKSEKWGKSEKSKESEVLEMPPKSKTVSVLKNIVKESKIQCCQFQHDAICIVLDVGLTSSSSGNIQALNQ